MRMNVIDPGHSYELYNEGANSNQVLNFVKKELAEGEPAGTLEKVQDGTTNEAVIEVLIDRLKFLDGEVPSPFNKSALQSLKLALDALNARTEDRVNRGIEGKRVVE